MSFYVPESAIQTEGFQIKSQANLFFLYMLCRNWHAWAAEYKILNDLSEANESLDLVAERLGNETAKNYWTVVGVDECDYVEAGVTAWDGNGMYTHGFIETEIASRNLPWPGNWYPLQVFSVPGFSIQFREHELIRTVYINCELCLPDEDCDHWDGMTGSWVSVDFPLPDPAIAKELLINVADETRLGVFSCFAATLLVKEFLNSPEQRSLAQEVISRAVETFRGLSSQDRELVLADLNSLPEFTYVMYQEGKFPWQQDFGNLMLGGSLTEAEEILLRIANAPELQVESWSAINTLVFSLLIPARRLDEARTWCENLIVRGSGFEYWNAISNLGTVEYESGNTEIAKALFEQVIDGEEGPVDEAREYLGRIAAGKI